MVANIGANWEQLLAQSKQACAQEDFGRAEVLLNNALEQAYSQGAPEYSSAEIFFTMGWCNEAQGRTQDAIKRYKQALGTLERSVGPDAEATVTVRNRLRTLTEAANYPTIQAAPSQNSDFSVPQTSQQNAPQPGQNQAQASQNRAYSPQNQMHPAQGQAQALSQHQSSPQYREQPGENKKRKGKFAQPANNDPTYEEHLSAVELNRGNLLVEEFVHPREKTYGMISSAIGVAVYGLSALCLIGFILAPLALLGAFISGGIHLGALRSRSIKVSDRQFPEVYALIEQFCSQMKMEIPQVYVVYEHGLLNAFAQRLHRKDMILISADVLELAYEYGENELSFVICHELAHVKLGHVKWAWLHIPASVVPFLGTAYSRACEYSCDRVAQHFAPEGALFGLVALAAGTKLYRKVNLHALYEEADATWGFWTWYHEIQSTHPNLLNRIRSIGITEAQIKGRR